MVQVVWITEPATESQLAGTYHSIKQKDVSPPPFHSRFDTSNFSRNKTFNQNRGQGREEMLLTKTALGERNIFKDILAYFY